MSSQVPMPGRVGVVLTVKIGKPHGNSRTSAEKEPTTLFYDVTEDSYASLRCRISDRVKDIVDRYNNAHCTSRSKSTMVYDDAFLVLIKQAVNTKQADYTVADESNFNSTAKSAWSYHCKKANPGDFSLELFVYLEKEDKNAQQIRRATSDRVALMSQRILSVERQRQPGPSELQYLSTTFARQIEEPDFANLPQTRTTQQLRHVDEQVERISQQRESNIVATAAEFCEVRTQINGVVVPIQVNVADLRRILGLPPYPLLAPFRPPVASAAPSTNVEDVDHEDDREFQL
ncbi:hypothetical protein AC1031_009977 [Aphanomyces cochlioides]|nr:hypothetical protein AC1031_009977 [Aphanomyces cochlioides]